MTWHRVALIVVLLIRTGADPVRAGEPAPSDVVAGLLDPHADVRAAAAARLGSADLLAAAPAIPVLVEALDDEVRAVAQASQDAIVALADRAAPVLFEDLDEVAGHGAIAPLFAAMGDALGVEDIAAGLVAGSEDDRRVLFVGLATLPVARNAELPSRRTGPEEWRSGLRLAAVEASRTRGADRRSASACVALLAYRIAWVHARRAGGALARLAAPEILPRLAKRLGAPGDDHRSSLAIRFVAATGVGDADVVRALAAADRTAGGSGRSDGGMRTDVAGALGRLSAAEPTARAVLERVPPRVFRFVAARVAASGGEHVVATQARLAGGDVALVLARIAAEAGDRSSGLRPIFAAYFDSYEPDDRIEDAARGVEAMGESDAETRVRIEALLPTLTDRKGPRVAVAAALLAVAPGDAGATVALLEAIAERPPPREDGHGTRDSAVTRRARAIVSLAVGGTGSDALRGLESGLEPISRRALEFPAEITRLRAAGTGVARLAGPESFDVGLRLTQLLVHHAVEDESAGAYRELGQAASLAYETRSVGLRSLGLLGPAARPFAERVRGFLASTDPRLRYLAAQALRRIDG